MMFRTSRLIRFLHGITLGTASVLLLTSVIQAQPPVAAPAVPKIEDLGNQQDANAKKFQQFKEGLFRLATRLEKSDRPGDKETAKTIMNAIELAQKSGVENQFQKLVMGLKNTNLTSGDGLKLQAEEEQLRKALKEILDILMTDDELTKNKAEAARIAELLKEARNIKKNQERLQDAVESKNGDTDNLAKQQEKIAKSTKELAKKIDGKEGLPGDSPAKPAPGSKGVNEAIPYQEGAKNDLDKNNRPDAGQKQEIIVCKLYDAILELENRLKQLREEEMKTLLANVEARVDKMLAMQIEVHEATKSIDGAVTKNNGVQTVADKQKAQQQGDRESEIVIEADRALKLLESEGSAVAFARLLEEVRQDMIAVQRRLNQAVVGSETQEIEKSIIDLLSQMKASLKKARVDKPTDPPSNDKPNEGKPQPKKLIDLVAELKLIRSMQETVNKRTEKHGKNAEQSNDPIVKSEFRQISNRQARLHDMLEKLANGENK